MSDAPERISLMPSDGWSWCEGRPAHQEDAIEYIRADKVAALVDALDDVADECTSDEIPEGYGPDTTESQEFHRGYDAALHRVRRALAMFRGDAKP